MPFISTPDGDVKKVFITDSWLLDQFVGNTLWCWGDNTNGTIGDNTSTARSSPVQTVTGGTSWKYAQSGYFHQAGLKTDGTYWLWGRNQAGQLGDNTTTNKSSPVQTVTAGTNWKQISPGGSFSAGIKTDGTLWLWGDNTVGQLGDNTTTHRSSPVQTVSGGTSWKQVACGYYHTAAIKTDGTLWTWGYNAYGQLGDNTSVRKSSPVQTVSAGTTWLQVTSAIYTTFAIKTDNTLWGWGLNTALGVSGGPGMLGDNTTTNRSSPVQTVSGGTNWKSVAAFCYHTAAIKTDGTLWTWGTNRTGQLGDNTTTHRSSPVQTVSGGTNWKQVVAAGQPPSGSNDEHTVAIKNDGTLWTWGCNAIGQLGDNTTTNRSSPVQTVAGGSTWKQVYGGRSFSIAVKNG